MKKNFVFSVLLWALVIFATLVSQPAAAKGQVIAQGTTAVPVYRFVYKSLNIHVYRTVPDLPGEGWSSEGVVFYISPVPLPYTVPLFVTYNNGLRDHLYTVDPVERDKSIKDFGFLSQGVFGYVVPTDKDYPGSKPLYRWFTKIAWFQDHFYQVSASPVTSYLPEGIACRVWTQPLKLPFRMLEMYAPAAGTNLHINDTPVISWKVWSGEGYIRLAYSADNGVSWHAITTIANKGSFGEVNNQSYSNWKVPADAVGKILIKADWVKASSGPELPWASDTRGPLAVSPANFRVIRRP